MDVELYPITYWLVGFFGCIFVLGVVTNAAVAFASFHDKKLRNSCNVLVALCCLSDGLHTCGHITLVYAFTSGNLFMDSMTCVWFQILPVIGQNCGCAFTVAIGFDRLFACYDPLSYGAKNAKVYTLCHLAGVSVYVGYQLYNVISNLYSMDVIFMVPSAYMGGAKEQFWNVSLCSDLRYCRRENQNKHAKTANHMKGLEARLFKSLLVILAFLILGHIGAIGVANVLITNIKNPDFKMGVVMDLVIGIPVNISLVSNYFIYYTTSSDYRKAFRAQFAFITRKTSSIGSVNSSGVLNPKVSSGFLSSKCRIHSKRLIVYFLPIDARDFSQSVLMDVELYPITYWLVGFFGTIFVVGVVTNAAVAFASYHDSRLRNSCNILIAFASIADCLHLSGHIVLIYAFATGNLLMKSTTCVWIEILPIIGQNSGTAFTVAIGIDRVFACFSPVKYGRKNPIIYICCHLVGISLYLAYHFYNLFANLYPT
ncbi:hypothetical protein PRIPAC_85199 [Pristionchus pacificus]|uniref:G protein-coupled receptor n=1 Tax=Pristionchus pacificus TaxID=54126 RepID=A0A2A6BGQ3_PRIPA|nr:hypothetical protein PRIPAC_85199 [Pristionchus pacificus]|eukprot:PDM65095.1 G protein-coupled receptor [Pristionchus pacificus]